MPHDTKPQEVAALAQHALPEDDLSVARGEGARSLGYVYNYVL